MPLHAPASSSRHPAGAKRALVVSGGGSKGAFAVGAIEYMVKERHLDFDIVSGTSTGAVIATLVVAEELDLLCSIYSTVTTRQVLKRNSPPAVLAGTVPSWYSTKPLEGLIDRKLTPEIAAKVLGSAKQMFLATVCLQTGAIVYFQAGGEKGRSDDPTATVQPIQDRAQLIHAILASTNQPVLMPPVAVEPGSPVQYVDGGVRAYAPIQIAVDNGAEEIYAVVMSPEPTARMQKTEQFTWIYKTLLRTIDLLTQQVGECSLRYQQRENEYLRLLEQVRDQVEQQPQLAPQVTSLLESELNPGRGKHPVTLHLIRPREELPTDGLEFDPATMKDMIKTGREQAKQVLGARL